MHLRIRRRRERLQLTGSELARRSGISPTYVSLIEKGAKVPEEEVAVRIAHSLEDDPEIYRAWALSTRYGSIDKTITSTEKLQRFRSDPEAWRQLEQGEAISAAPAAPEGEAAPFELRQSQAADWTMALASRAPASAPAPMQTREFLEDASSAIVKRPAPMLEVPLYPEGEDPLRSAPVGHPLMLDRRFLPEGVEPGALFAYQVRRDDTVRATGAVALGSYVVIERGAGRVAPDRLYAVRLHGRVVVARVLLSSRSLLVLPPEGKTKYDVIELESTGDVGAHVVGQVVLVVGGARG